MRGIRFYIAHNNFDAVKQTIVNQTTFPFHFVYSKKKLIERENLSLQVRYTFELNICFLTKESSLKEKLVLLTSSHVCISSRDISKLSIFSLNNNGKLIKAAQRVAAVKYKKVTALSKSF